MALILAADHDVSIAQMIVQPLASLRHRVITAATVERAMEWLHQASQVPDLIIADVGLRSFRGHEFIQALKIGSSFRDIPILVQTKGTECEIFELCEGTLHKPYSSRELINAVNMVLSRTSYFG